MSIQPLQQLQAADFDAFAVYLNLHLQENGLPPSGYFQPLARAHSVFAPERADAFRQALQRPLDGPGWRRVWVARDPAGRICAHVDLRAHPEPHTEHRCLLGMGVRQDQRRRGLGACLLTLATDWARQAGLAWLDLQVLSQNAAAVALYRRCGFAAVGERPDMFRIDGHSLGYTSMSLSLKECP